MQSDYQKHTNEKRMEMIRQVAKELPKACGDFLRAISTTTSTLTRLAYAYDLRIFFTFLTTELPEYNHADLRSLQDSDIDRIKQRELEQYVEYLTMYYKNLESENDEKLISKPIYNHELGIMRKLSTQKSTECFPSYKAVKDYRTGSKSSRCLQKLAIMRCCACFWALASASANASALIWMMSTFLKTPFW